MLVRTHLLKVLTINSIYTSMNTGPHELSTFCKTSSLNTNSLGMKFSTHKLRDIFKQHFVKFIDSCMQCFILL